MGSETLRLPAEVTNLHLAQAYLASRASRFGLDDRQADRLALALEEVFVNICHYAYPGVAGMVELSCRSDGDRFVVEVVDEGIAFDAASLPDPDTAANIEERRAGGLGWFLVRRLMSEIDYRRENGRNIVHMVFHRGEPAANVAGTR